MGTLGLNNPNLAAFQNNIIPRGVDLLRSKINQDLGVYVANPTAVIQAGMLVSQDASGFIVPALGQPVFGVAKWNQATSLTATAVDEPISFGAAGAVANLRHPVISSLQLRSAPGFGGSQFTVVTDYQVSAPNGTVTQVSGGGITLNTTVYATYTYIIQPSDLDFVGRNFWNSVDDVSVANNRITVIQDATTLFVTTYDTSRTYSLSGVGSNLYSAGAVTPALAGLFTNNAAENGQLVGKVMQLPSATDPFLGVKLHRDFGASS